MNNAGFVIADTNIGVGYFFKHFIDRQLSFDFHVTLTYWIDWRSHRYGIIHRLLNLETCRFYVPSSVDWWPWERFSIGIIYRSPISSSWLAYFVITTWLSRQFYFCINTLHPHFSFLYPRPTKLEGGILDSPCPSVCPSVCRRHGFRSISQVCFGISISNFICMLMVAIGRSLLIFSDVTFKMAAWRPYWIFLFPDSNLTLALNINFKLQRHNTYVYG